MRGVRVDLLTREYPPDVYGIWMRDDIVGLFEFHDRFRRGEIEVIEEENLVDNARIMGNRLREGLNALKEKYPVIGDVRGMGLMQGMELVGEKKKPDVESTKRVMELTRNHGLLVGKGGTYGNVLRVAPPLNVDKDEIDQALKVLDQSFGQLGH